MEHVVTDGQVVLQAERLQHHSVPDRESQPQLLVGVSWGRGESERSHFNLSRFCKTSGRRKKGHFKEDARQRRSATLTWRRRQCCHIWFHVGRKRGLHVRIRRQIWWNTTSWGHRGCGVSRDRGVGVVSGPWGLVKGSQYVNKICSHSGLGQL